MNIILKNLNVVFVTPNISELVEFVKKSNVAKISNGMESHVSVNLVTSTIH